MRKIVVMLLMVFLLGNIGYGQERDFRGVSYGFQVIRFQDEFGLGVHLLTPEVQNLRIPLKINVNWFEHLNAQQSYSWSPFLNIQSGIHYQRCVASRMNLYAEGGVILMFPNTKFSDTHMEFGGYGLFGLEFFLTEMGTYNPSYFIEMGGVGTYAVANKISSNPLYANGFLVSVGFRF